MRRERAIGADGKVRGGLNFFNLISIKSITYAAHSIKLTYILKGQRYIREAIKRYIAFGAFREIAWVSGAFLNMV